MINDTYLEFIIFVSPRLSLFRHDFRPVNSNKRSVDKSGEMLFENKSQSHHASSKTAELNCHNHSDTNSSASSELIDDGITQPDGEFDAGSAASGTSGGEDAVVTMSAAKRQALKENGQIGDAKSTGASVDTSLISTSSASTSSSPSNLASTGLKMNPTSSWPKQAFDETRLFSHRFNNKVPTRDKNLGEEHIYIMFLFKAGANLSSPHNLNSGVQQSSSPNTSSSSSSSGSANTTDSFYNMMHSSGGPAAQPGNSNFHSFQYQQILAQLAQIHAQQGGFLPPPPPPPPPHAHLAGLLPPSAPLDHHLAAAAAAAAAAAHHDYAEKERLMAALANPHHHFMMSQRINNSSSDPKMHKRSTVSPNSSGGYSRHSGNMSPNGCGDDMDDDDQIEQVEDDEGDDIGIEDSQSLNAGTNGEWTYEEQFKQV